MKRHRYKFIVFFLILLSIVLIHGFWCNQALRVAEYQVESDKLPEGFKNYRIAQISDMHNAEFGKDNHKMIELLKESNPDMIVITGDMIDSRRTDMQVALDFAKNAVEVAPCYYVMGNHEFRIEEYPLFLNELKEIGVDVIRNEIRHIQSEEDELLLIGVDDPSSIPYLDNEEAMQMMLENLTDDDYFMILLSHRPELYDIYHHYGIDLILSGHVHGGQIRLPLLGGIYGPHQGLWPDYDGGHYVKDDSHLIVSKGIGNSLFPIRINNQPEIVLIELINDR